MESELVPIVNGNSLSAGRIILPTVIARAGERASRRFIEFFTANIRNPNTRAAYTQAVNQFMAWCDQYGLTLEILEPVAIAAYIEWLITRRSAPTVIGRVKAASKGRVQKQPF